MVLIQNSSLMLLPRILFVMIMVWQGCHAATFQLSSTSLTVSSLNNLSITLTRNSSPTAATNLELDFPSDFDVTTITSITLNGANLIIISNYSLTNSLTVVISLISTMQTNTNLIVLLNGITNPSYVTQFSNNIIGKFLYSSSIVESATYTTNALSVSTTTGSLTSCKWTFASMTNSNGNVTMTFSLAHQLPIGNNAITLSFTNQWSGIQNVSLKYGMTNRNSITTSLAKANVQFALPVTGITDYTVSATTTSIIISMITSVILTAGSTITFTITNIETPPLSQINPTTESLTVSTSNSNG
jgi:hypothetical protein